jgi:two-component system sensor histidine kinase KdpD
MPFFESEVGAMALALPLNAPIRRRGVLVVRSRERDLVVSASQRPLLDAVAALTSTAVERVHFVEVAGRTQVEIESERLRTSVLSAVSHDLRTPLTVVVGLAKLGRQRRFAAGQRAARAGDAPVPDGREPARHGPVARGAGQACGRKRDCPPRRQPRRRGACIAISLPVTRPPEALQTALPAADTLR